MNADLWRRAKDVFLAAVEVRGAARDALLAERCAGDPALLAEVRTLLAAEEGAGEFLEPPAFLPSLAADSATAAGPGAVPGAAAPAPAAGDLLGGRYLLGERIASGAFGTVHRAEDRLTGRPAAVKVLTGSRALADDSLRRETALLRRARLPGVAELLDDGLEDGYAWLAMALVAGEPFPGRAVPVPWETLAPTARSLLETLGTLHRFGVFHGDLKPANVLVDPRGIPVLLDLGVAREREEEDLPSGGTPAWLAPERFGGGPPDERSDLYSVGVMLYEALAGVPPHDADRMTRLAAARKSGVARPLAEAAPGVPAPAASVVDRLLSPDPARRPGSAEAALAALFPRGPGAPAAPVEAMVEEILRGKLPARRAGPLPEEALRPLFAGPDRVFHLREDGARALHLRTGGERHRVGEVLARWVRSGLARPVDGVLSVPRESLQRLRAEEEIAAWLPAGGAATPEAPARLRALAAARPPGSEERFFLLAAAGDAAAACAEAGDLGQRLQEEGRIDDSLAVLEEALALGRRGGMAPTDEEGILLSYLRLAKYAGTAATMDRLMYHLQRRKVRTPRAAAIESLARAVRLGFRGEGRAAVALIDSVNEVLDPVFEQVRWSARSDAIKNSPPGETWVRAEVVRTLRWQRSRPEDDNRRLARSTLSFLRYREGRFRSSARLRERAARRNRGPAGRANQLLSASAGYREIYHLDRAAALVRDAVEILRPLRVPGMMMNAESSLLCIEYRRGRDPEIDGELLEAALCARGNYDSGLVLLTAAAVAWRRRDPGAVPLAEAAAERFGETFGRWGREPMARALALAAGAAPGPGEPEALAARGAAIVYPGIALQVLGLVGMLKTGAAGRWGSRARECAAALDPLHLGRRREVLTPEEALRAVESDPPGIS